MEIALTRRPASASAPAVSVSRAAAVAVPLFGAAMLLSGFLLFLVEPMIARMVLPILGGVPMVWNACVVFFQIVMLAGYGYAFGASRWLTVRRQVMVHAAILSAPAAVLPVLIESGSAHPPSGNPVGWLLLLLAGTVGLPFFVLSTTASVLQHWLSKTDHPSGRDPYFLYATSNIGCLLALASYPVLVEPSLTLRAQARLWTVGYAVFAALAAGCGVYAWRHSSHSAANAGPEDAASPRQGLSAVRRARWIALAFVPSSLMLAVTSHISTDVAAVPLLWIVPLALYLLTFVLGFGRTATGARSMAARALPLLVVPLALFMIARVREPLAAILPLHLCAFAAIAQYCHSALSAERPDRSHLTEFYFWLSFGGMLGGLFNTLAAPVLFTSVLEFPLIVLGACLLFKTEGEEPHARSRTLAACAWPIGIGALTVAVLVSSRVLDLRFQVQLAMLAIPAILAFSQRRHGVRFGTSMAALIGAGLALGSQDVRELYSTRTFFGVYRVYEDATGRYHGLAHGTTLHGEQATSAGRRAEPLTYYHPTGPFGDAWRTLPGAKGREIGVVGLGVGTLATYSRPNQHWTFFEIDPAIEAIARTPAWFSFMEQCGDRCRVVTGDARLSLAREPEHHYNLLVLDAFSSDSIPVHLMTREALALYVSRLAPDGAVMMHISNRHLRLAPIVARLGADRGLYGAQRVELPGRGSWAEGKRGSQWIVLSRKPTDIAPLIRHAGWIPLTASPSTPLWTDDFSNILGVLSLW